MITPQVIVPALLAPLIGYRIYRRFRANFGQQPVQPNRIVVRLVVLSLVVALFVAFAIHSATLLEGAAGGLIAGAALAMLGLRHTKFSSDANGSYYTPNTYIGLVVTLLLVSRIVYRLTTMFLVPQIAAPLPADPYASMGQSPLTLALLMLTLGYYLAYFAGILIKTRKPA
ncbi:MAG: DUF1453 domain-containing protein [Gammaproteobacteria bacterium]